MLSCRRLQSLRAWSICVGRVSQLPRGAANVDLPIIIDKYESQPWKPYNDHGYDHIPDAEQPNLTHTFTNYFAKLTDIVNDTIFMFYAPRERFTSRKLLDFYGRYKKWYGDLPQSLQLHQVSTPHVLTLQ